MRLKTIKLAGFKSFVDPTTLVLQSNITAIAGPNGCGKSNIVDAIRWVIGESSAKQLRGELLTDVIFNGTTGRKPVGQASIELQFDNSKGSLGGEYAQYNEIAIRREITREGQSQFYLNGTRCRRRDVTDLFLGTGLGPSSYAIIEQGIVSKLIEGKPDELRTYLEEAAGISRYRERRRETENRIRNTRENLARLTDLRLEIEKQLDHLKRQANAAERFKVLKQEQRLLKAQLHALHCKNLDIRLTEQHAALNEQTVQQEAKTADYRRVELEIEQKRSQQVILNEEFNAIQERFYQSGAEIARQEQQIQHIQERERQLTTDLLQMEEGWSEAEQNLEEDRIQIETLTAELAIIEPEIQRSAETAAQSAAQLQHAEQQLADWQAEWERFQTDAAQIEQKVQLEQTRLQHLTQKTQGIEQRIQRLEEQRKTWDVAQLPEEIALLSSQADEYQQQVVSLQEALVLVKEQIQQQRTINSQQQSERDKARQDLHKLLNQQTSLDALQKAALGKANQGTADWLKQQGWTERPRLLEGLTVESGWETAVETALATYLEAVCTENSADFLTAAENLAAGKLTVFNTAAAVNAPTSSNNKTTTLASKVQARWPIADLLAGIYAVENSAEALEILSSLAAHESIVTRDGICFGPSWVRVSKNHDEMAGVLQRKIALEEISITIEKQELLLETYETQLQDGQQILIQLEDQRDSQQRELTSTAAKHSEFNAQLSSKQAHFEQLRQREAAALHELSEQQEQLAQAQEQAASIQIILQQAETEQQEYRAQKDTLIENRDAHKESTQSFRQRAQADKQRAEEYQVRSSSIQSQLHYLDQNIKRAEKQLVQLQERREALIARREEIQAPLPDLQNSLQESLEQRLEVEKELTIAKQKVNQLDHELRESEKLRVQIERDAQTIRDVLEQIRIEQSTTQARKQNHLEQIAETTFVLETLLEEMPPEANETDWQQRLEQVDSRIQRLGAINLAAIDEYNTQLERKTYLDSQDKDLCEALETLEDAIRKIDRESRTRLRETFDRANGYFKELFHKVFEGGQAELELTSDELLDAGVIIRAQPPGKRNTQLHLLSGGEKALTAIALVFALFQLNPAPFCVLDEVDAPLDEANVRRYSRLVQAMSETVQFLFISHNKVTMEIAQQLVGVTMQEPGVSRLVSVDIEQAMAMASV